MSTKRLYLDYNATSPLSESTLKWLKSGDIFFANPASQHSRGKQSRRAINQVREKILSLFNVKESETRLFFHSGATEALSTLMYSFAESTRLTKKKLCVFYSVLDHPAVVELSQKYWGEHVQFYKLKLKHDLAYNHEENLAQIIQLKNQYPEAVILYHHLWVHNETGFVSPLEDLVPLKVIKDLYIHVDAVQVPGKIQNYDSLVVGDIWSFSAHKFGALKGVGFSLMKSNLPFCPLLVGGGQQEKLRGGTENVQGIMSIGYALDDLSKVDFLKTNKYREDLVDYLKSELNGVGDIIDFKERIKASNTIYFYLYEVTSDVALALFDLNGLEISAGSACSSGAARPSVLLTELGLSSYAKNGLRISLNFSLTEEEFGFIKTTLSGIFRKLKNNK